MLQQTAVQWLQKCLSIHLSHEQQMQFEGLFQQAKEMEKSRIINAWDNGYATGGANGSNDWVNECELTDNGEYYYNETYKK